MSVETHKVCGYLQRKARGKLLSPWKRWYCVLNGRLLIFYKSESDYRKMNSFNDVIDLGLVYSVDRAPGFDFGIILSTHNGHTWLRTRDPLSCSMWLESLQGAIVLRTPKEVLTQPGFDFNVQVSKDSPQEAAKETTVGERKSLASKLFRFSLDLIPGHNYSTFDGRKIGKRESSYNDVTAPATDKIPRRARKIFSIRPISGSVSDFLLMKSPETQPALGVLNHPGKKQKRSTATPRLPTSPVVEKLISKAEVQKNPEVYSEDDEKESEVPPNDILDSKTEHDSQISRQNEETIPIGHFESSSSGIGEREEAPDSIGQPETDSSPIGGFEKGLPPNNETVVLNEEPLRKKGSVRKEAKKQSEKKTPRRKSSLALLKNFLFPSKSGKSKAQQDGEYSKQAPTQFNEEQNKFREAAETRDEVNICEKADDDQTTDVQTKSAYTEKDIETALDRIEKSEDKEPQIATVLAVIEGPDTPLPTTVDRYHESNQQETDCHHSLMQQVATWIQNIPPSANLENIHLDAERRRPKSFSSYEERPPLPPKLRQRCSSPDYDVPTSPPVPVKLENFQVDAQACDASQQKAESLQNDTEIKREFEDETLQSSLAVNKGLEPNIQKLREKVEPVVVVTADTCVTEECVTEEVKPRKVSHLVQFFTTQISQEQQMDPVRKFRDQVNENRLSFACSEVETVTEETVEENFDN